MSPVLCCSVTGKVALVRQMMFCFYRCHQVAVYSLRVCKRRGEKVSNYSLVNFRAIAQDNEDNQNNKTTVSYMNIYIYILKLQHRFRITVFRSV